MQIWAPGRGQHHAAQNRAHSMATRIHSKTGISYALVFCRPIHGPLEFALPLPWLRQCLSTCKQVAIFNQDTCQKGKIYNKNLTSTSSKNVSALPMPRLAVLLAAARTDSAASGFQNGSQQGSSQLQPNMALTKKEWPGTWPKAEAKNGFGQTSQKHQHNFALSTTWYFPWGFRERLDEPAKLCLSRNRCKSGKNTWQKCTLNIFHQNKTWNLELYHPPQ